MNPSGSDSLVLTEASPPHPTPVRLLSLLLLLSLFFSLSAPLSPPSPAPSKISHTPSPSYWLHQILSLALPALSSISHYFHPPLPPRAHPPHFSLPLSPSLSPSLSLSLCFPRCLSPSLCLPLSLPFPPSVSPPLCTRGGRGTVVAGWGPGWYGWRARVGPHGQT